MRERTNSIECAKFRKYNLCIRISSHCWMASTEIAAPGMSEYERAKAAFDYMIENTYLDEPIGLELWRIHGGGEKAILYLEQRALSPLRFGQGCARTTPPR